MERFLDCFRSLLDHDLNNSPDSCPVSVYAKSALRTGLTKKLVTDRSEGASRAAYDKFLGMNDHCQGYELRVESSWDEELVGTVKAVLYKFFYPNGFCIIDDSFVDRMKPGPGAAILSSGGSLYEKLFNSRLSYTRDWIRSRFSRAMRSSPTRRCAFKGVRVKGWERTSGSKMSFVPKENDIDRIVCIEPSLNMLFQLGMASVLEDRLRSYFGIDLALQPDNNRELARQGSLKGTFCTIDLSSASDCISRKLVDHLLPKEVVDWLNILRSDRVSVPEFGAVHDLHMVSTMGNGFTFPLQTILFSAIVKAVYLQNEKMIRNPGRKLPGRASLSLGNWGVFGDDIIVESDCSRRVLHALRLFGFFPNPKKTFTEGPFRESCGSDWFNGEPVRAAYIKSLSTVQDRFIAINQLNAWTAKTGIALPLSVNYLLESVPPWLVPLHEPDFAGIRVPSDFLSGKNRSYKCFEVRAVKKKMDRTRMRARGEVYNSYGLYISFLWGELRRGELGVRSDDLVFRSRFKRTHNWDLLESFQGQAWLKEPDLNVRRLMLSRASDDAQRLTVAVYANLEIGRVEG